MALFSCSNLIAEMCRRTRLRVVRFFPRSVLNQFEMALLSSQLLHSPRRRESPRCGLQRGEAKHGRGSMIDHLPLHHWLTNLNPEALSVHVVTSIDNIIRPILYHHNNRPDHNLHTAYAERLCSWHTHFFTETNVGCHSVCKLIKGTCGVWYTQISPPTPPLLHLYISSLSWPHCPDHMLCIF